VQKINFSKQIRHELFLDMPTRTIARRGCRESLNRSAPYRQN